MSVKNCTKCGELKPLSEYFKCKSQKSGLQPACKKCSTIAIRECNRTKVGLISRIYIRQVYSSKKRGHSDPDYQKYQLEFFMLNHPQFNSLYNICLFLYQVLVALYCLFSSLRHNVILIK